MKIPALEIRCSSLHKIMVTPKKDEVISEGAKTHIFELFKQYKFKYTKEIDSEEMIKGRLCENEAIRNSGLIRGRAYQKSDLPRQHKVIVEIDGVQAILSGECDIFDEANSLIIDTKCSFSIDSFPVCTMEAEKKAKKAGYDWQMHGYMLLYQAKSACVDYWLLETPLELFSPWQLENKPDFIAKHTTFVSQIPYYERVTHVMYPLEERKQGEIVARMRDALNFWIDLHNKETVQNKAIS